MNLKNRIEKLEQITKTSNFSLRQFIGKQLDMDLSLSDDAEFRRYLVLWLKRCVATDTSQNCDNWSSNKLLIEFKRSLQERNEHKGQNSKT